MPVRRPPCAAASLRALAEFARSRLPGRPGARPAPPPAAAAAAFLPNWIGDAVMATPAVRALREQFPEARLIGVMRPYVAGVLEGSPWLDDVLLLDRNGRVWPGVAWQSAPAPAGRGRPASEFFPPAGPGRLVGRLPAPCRLPPLWPSLSADRRPGAGRGANGKLLPSPVIDAYNLLARGGQPRAGLPHGVVHHGRRRAGRRHRLAEGRSGPFPRSDLPESGGAYGAAKHWPADPLPCSSKQLVDDAGRRGSGAVRPGERDLARQIVALARSARRPYPGRAATCRSG